MALIVALSSPLLIAATGLAVDISYWYQNQTSLQSAADAAAMAAAFNNTQLTQTDDAAKSTAALPYARAAADAATNGQFGLVSGSPGTNVTLTVMPSTLNNGTAILSYTATVTIPRTDFFSRVYGMGLAGMLGGSQSASASAAIVTKTSSTSGGCLIALGKNGGGIAATGGATITSPNCGIVSDSTAACGGSKKALTGSIALNPSATISALAVSAAGCVNVDTNGGASIKSPSGNALTIGTNGENDPYAAFANAGLPPWPNLPPPPTLTNTTGAVSLGYTPSFSQPWGSCSPDYSAQCVLNPYSFTGGISANTTSLELTSGGNSSPYGSTYVVAGGMSLTNGTVKLDGTLPTTFYVTGAETTDKHTGVTAITNYAITLGAPTSTIGGGIFYLNGGMTINGGSSTVNVGQGTYLMTAYSGNTESTSNNAGGLYLQDGTTVFTGGTFYFDGGLDIGGSASVIFGPGIYYFRNGNFTVSNGGHLTANGATFILEGTASYHFNGGTALNLSAPVPDNATHPTNCILPLPSSDSTAPVYPLSTYSLSPIAVTPSSGSVTATNSGTTGKPATPYPWDGTNGLGICGMLIYQTADDAATDTITEGASSIMNGLIYTPAAALSLSGTGNIQATTNTDGTAGTFAILANSFSLSGSANITVSADKNAGMQLGTTTTTTTLPPLLVQ